MAFNLGYQKLSKFKKMIAAVNRGEWTQASKEMLDSLWARQVGQRSEELAELMENG